MAYYFVKNTAKSVGKMFPFKEISVTEQQPFVCKAKTILMLNENLQNVSSKFIDLLQSELSIEKLTKKTENWHILEWSDFEKELKKLKITLTGEQKEDWFERFNRLKTEAQTLKATIDKTVKEIDQMVYALYELSNEEITVIEKSI